MNGVTRSGPHTRRCDRPVRVRDRPSAAARAATFLGEDTSATKYAGTFLDSGGNPIASFRNDKHVLMPGLPTSAAGLASGELWNDSGTLKVVT